MQTGTYISGVGHVFLLGWAALGSVSFNEVAAPEVKVADVALISVAEFSALQSHAPKPAVDVAAPLVPVEDIEAPKPPDADTTPNQAKAEEPDDPQPAGRAPDVTEIAELPQTDAQIDPPEEFDTPSTDQIGATLIVPTAQISSEDRAGQRQPDKLAQVDASEAPAPRVDTEAAPKPATDAQRADEVETASVADAAAEAPAEDTTEKAPDQASTEIITEAKATATEAAPVRSSRPRGRPAKLVESVDTPSAIEAALAAAQAEQAANTSKSAREVPSGPPLTKAEKDGFRFAVQKCWNVNPSSESARITVTVAVSMDEKGKPRAATIKMLSSTDGTPGAVVSAFDAARRAILRCGGQGFDLPSEKYDHWRDVEMTFNPENMRIK